PPPGAGQPAPQQPAGGLPPPYTNTNRIRFDEVNTRPPVYECVADLAKSLDAYKNANGTEKDKQAELVKTSLKHIDQEISSRFDSIKRRFKETGELSIKELLAWDKAATSADAVRDKFANKQIGGAIKAADTLWQYLDKHDAHRPAEEVSRLLPWAEP